MGYLFLPLSNTRCEATEMLKELLQHVALDIALGAGAVKSLPPEAVQGCGGTTPPCCDRVYSTNVEGTTPTC
jgi:hypothetical protein